MVLATPDRPSRRACSHARHRHSSNRKSSAACRADAETTLAVGSAGILFL
jgi:hypothetical protein